MKRSSSRSSRSRRGGGGSLSWRALLANPVAPVLIGLAIVLGVGVWVTRDAPTAKEPAEETEKADPGSSTPPATGSTGTTGSKGTTSDRPETKPAETPPSTPPTETFNPAGENTTVADPVVQAGRAKIDLSGGAAETMKATLYFSDGLKNGMSLQPVEVKIERTVSRLRATVEHLLNPPQDLKLYNSVPAGTAIGKGGVDFDRETGVATVDLTAEIANIKGSAAVNEFMASLVYSLTEIPDVKSVQLWVNGKPAMLDGREWSKPLSRAEIDARTGFTVEPVIKYNGN